jgi:hypothetical protein
MHFTKYHYGHQIGGDVINGSCILHEGNENLHRKFESENMKEKDHLGNIGVDGFESYINM